MLDFTIEQKISNLVSDQFPSFYQEEGPIFIQFVKAYYEWLEEEGNVLQRSRNILSYTDIDTTLDDFLIFFQKKYLYGIPFDVIINKRFLLKHVLDVYRSKGSIQCYRLLFRLIYNQDIDVYLPGRDVLRASDGTWIEGRYIEVTNQENLKDLIGNIIYGMSSTETAVVESVVTEPINDNIIATLYVSNIFPKNGKFIVGEKIIKQSDLSSSTLAQIVSAAPSVLGSLDSLEIINGGRDYAIGDVLKVVSRDLVTNDRIATGIDGLVRVTSTFRGRGRLNFDIRKSGFGYTNNVIEFFYNSPTDTTGTGASYQVGVLSNVQEIQYNTDLIVDYANLSLDSVSFGFPLNPSGNVSSNVGSMLSFTTEPFGSIATLTDLVSGNSYTETPITVVRSVLTSNALIGNVSYDTSSNTITGTSTDFDILFSNNDVIYIQADSSDSNTVEYHLIKTVVSNTNIELYGPPSLNSTANAIHKIAPSILPANFGIAEPIMYQVDGSIPGLNANIVASALSGNDVVSTVSALNSGRGYVENEIVTLYKYGAITVPVIVNGGTGYSNNESMIFIGGNPNESAEGYIQTNSNGSINLIILEYAGAGYTEVPEVRIQTLNGSGAVLTTTVTEFNTQYPVTGRVRKGGLGRKQGYYSTTQGHLNSDKYIQDSYYYQDFSYEIQAASTLNKYKDILYRTFHTSGTELFGKFLLLDKNDSRLGIKNEPSEYSNVHLQKLSSQITTDSNIVKADSSIIISDTFAGYLSCDSDIVTTDYEFITLDATEIYGVEFMTTDSDLQTSDIDYDYLTADTNYIFDFEGMSFIRADSSLYKADITTITTDQRYIF